MLAEVEPRRNSARASRKWPAHPPHSSNEGPLLRVRQLKPVQHYANTFGLLIVTLQLPLGGYHGLTPTPSFVPTPPILYESTSSPATCIDVSQTPTPAALRIWSQSYSDEDSDYTKSIIQSLVTDVEPTKTTIQEGNMTGVKTKATIGLLSTLISYVSINSYLRQTHPDLFVWRPEDREEDQWVATSKYWLDRKACRWLGLCGVPHLRFVQSRFGHKPDIEPEQLSSDVPGVDWENAWTEGKDRPEDWSSDERVLREIPDYVMEYAPLVHLFSGEQFWPCDIAEHLAHVTPHLNYTPISSESEHPSLETLDEFNQYQRGRWVYLKSNDNVEERPEWLEGERNIPADPTDPNDMFEGNDGWVHRPGKTYLQGVKDAFHDLKDWWSPGDETSDHDNDYKKSRSGQSFKKQNGSFRTTFHEELKRSMPNIHGKQIRGGRSDAPAVLLTVDKGHGVVDAFWFFFYSFNLGNVVFNIRFGNHVGDWEHTAIRFHHGVPKVVFFSEHNFGSAYSYEAVEKIGKRPVIYSATGTHAMYATSGLHPYVLPWGILHDETDRGPLWDPALNSHMYTYDYKNETLRASTRTPHAPIGWFHYHGRWGDKYYPLGDNRQYRFAGQYHYVNGPLGPKFKDLGRKKMCAGPPGGPCVIKHWIGGSDNIRLASDLDFDEKSDIEI